MTLSRTDPPAGCADAGIYAVAYAILKLVIPAKEFAQGLERLGFNGSPAVDAPGCVENVSMELGRIVNFLETMRPGCDE